MHVPVYTLWLLTKSVRISSPGPLRGLSGNGHPSSNATSDIARLGPKMVRIPV
jgi:hypothetical protein